MKPGQGKAKRERRLARKKAEKAEASAQGKQNDMNAKSKQNVKVLSGRTDSTVAAAPTIKKNRRPKKKAAWKCSVFIGQLPWDTTEEVVKSALGKVGVKNATIRMLHDKITERFRGICFVDVETEKDRTKILDLHHTKIKGREINVEKANVGSSRKQEVDQEATDEGAEGSRPERLRFQQHLSEKEVWMLVEEAIEGSEGLLREDDFDEKNCSFLGLLEVSVAQKALESVCKGFKGKDIRNRQAYVMGIIEKVAQKQHALKSRRGAKSQQT